MKAFRFPYTRYVVSSPRAKKAEYVYRPVIPVQLSLGARSITFDALVDSGADECTFPGWIIKTLCKDLFRGKERIFSGIGGSVLSYLHRTHLALSDVRFITDVYYSHEWDDMPFGLLGQAGFFCYFDVTMSYRTRTIEFRTR